MKGCFLLQRRFAFIGHALAILLKDKYGVTDFCAYVYTRDSFEFLKFQKDILYTNLLLDEDIHNNYKEERLDKDYLDWLEKEYGIPNLWLYAETDRIIRFNQLIREYPYEKSKYNHQDILKIIQSRAKTIIDFLEKEKPDFLVLSVIGAIGSFLLYTIAKKKGIKVLVIRPMSTENRWTLSLSYDNVEYIEDRYKKIKEGAENPHSQAARNFLKKFADNPTHYFIDYSPEKQATNARKQFKFLTPKNLLGSAWWFIKNNYLYYRNNNKKDYSNIKPWEAVFDKTKRKIRMLIGFKDLTNNPDFTENYAFYPLHYEPEIATLLLAPFFTDQLWLIKQIAKCLPFDYKIYVKEHPAMVGYRPRSFYKELKKIPNLKLISPSVKSFSLINGAKIVTTITGSVGWESSLLKKPVITFGKIFFNSLSTVKNCTDITKLSFVLKDRIDNHKYDEKELVDFISAIFAESVNVDITQMWEVEGGSKYKERSSELIPFVDFMASKLGLKKI